MSLEEKKGKACISSSSGWVAALLNILPGLGVGYIYQRRWKAYWTTNFVSLLWVIFSLLIEARVDPADPAPVNGLLNFFGLLFIALITALEAAIAVKRSRDQSGLN